MKFLKLLFSKIFASAFLLLLQALIIISVLLFYENYFVFFQIFNLILGILILLGIFNKKESPEFKLPWIVIILVVPFYGLIIYCMFANSKMPSRQYKNMIENICRSGKYSGLTVSEDQEITDFLGDYAGIENYLRKNAYGKGHLNNKAEYFKTGKDFYYDLVEELKRAEKFIFMEYFIISPGKMWGGILSVLRDKVNEGVEVRILYDDIGSAGLLESNYFKKLQKEGINCLKFNPFRPVVSGIHNNRDHRKITVIDGKVGYTGGINIGDEYINEIERFGYWKDTAVKIRGSAVGNLTAMFLQMFDSVKSTSSDYDKYINIEYEKFTGEGYVHPFGDGPKPVYTELVGSNNYINIINSAKEYVYISTPYLIPDYNLLSALRNAGYRGVDIRIITPHIPDKKIIFKMTRSNYKNLMQAGVKIYEYTPGFIHAKGMIADGKIAFVGTINLDYRSLVHHYECGVVLCKTPCIEDIKKDFEETLACSQEVLQENLQTGFFSSLATAVLNLLSPML